MLRESGIPLARADQDNSVSLVAAVEVGRPRNGFQHVAIRWVLLLPDGTELGDVEQANDVPAGSLDRAWGKTALLIAEAAYDGIVALYEKAPDVLAH